MKKNRKKLPRYWLGTRMPASLGYQPNQGAGNVSYSTKLGEDFTAEADAERKNIFPSAVNRFQQSATPLMHMWQNTDKLAIPTSAVSAMTTANTAATGGVAARLAAGGTADYMGSMFAGTPAASSSSTGAAAGSTAASTAGRTVLNTAGKALGVIGGAYGLANMAMDFAHNKDHRTAANMWDTVNTNTYTTDKGNTYNTYTAPNLQAELDYASAQKTSKNISNTIGAVGTGAAIGATIGSTVPVLGTAIGAGVGALYGLGSWLFGFGDTYEDTMNEYRKTQDVAALKSLQSEASAKNKDVKQGFYERLEDGKVGARLGKMPKYSKGKANAMVSNGETIGKFKDGTPGLLEYAYVVPGKVTENTAFADTKKAHVGNKEFVLSNNPMPGAGGLSFSQVGNITGDYMTPLIIQDMMNKNVLNLDGTLKAKCGKSPKYGWGRLPGMFMENPFQKQPLIAMENPFLINLTLPYPKEYYQGLDLQNSYIPESKKNLLWDILQERMSMLDLLNRKKLTDSKNNILSYKHGKTPKYNLGKFGDYALSTLPHLGSVLTNLYLYNRVKNAEEYAPTITTEATAALNYINQMMADRIDPRPYLNRSMQNYNQAAWNARRTPGMGLGGRVVMLDSLARAKQASDADILMKIDEANRVQRNKAYEAGITLDKFLAEQNTKNQWLQHAYRQQAHGQKETLLPQYLKNMYQGYINAAGDALRTSQYHLAMDNLERELKLWEQSVSKDYLAYLDNLRKLGKIV